MVVGKGAGSGRAPATAPQRGMRRGRRCPHLVEVLHEDAARRHPLSLRRAHNGTWSIGRDAVSSIRLTDPEVSRCHAVVQWQRGHFHVVDLAASRNGTWVNGERLAKGRRRVLYPGDRIQLGTSELEFRV